MRRTAALLPVKNKFVRMYPLKPSYVASLTPKKLKDDDFEKKEEQNKEEGDPIVTFSKPPPIPPLLIPLVLLSLSETRSDEN